MKNQGYSILITLLLCGMAFSSVSQNSNSTNGLGGSVDSLTKMAAEEFNRYNSSDKAYTWGLQACQIAEKSQDYELKIKAYSSLLQNANPISHYKQLEKYGLKAIKLSQTSGNKPHYWKALMNLSSVYLDAYHYEEAQQLALSAVDQAEALENDSLVCLSKLALGKALNVQSLKLEGFSYLFSAVRTAEEMGNKDLMIIAYIDMAYFYNFREGYSRSVRYMDQALKLIQQEYASDTTRVYDALLQKEEIGFYANNNKLDEILVETILKHADRNGNITLKNEALALFRSHLMEDLNFERLDVLYSREFPADLIRLREEQPILHAKVLASIHEYKNEIDWSLYYYRLSERLLDEEQNLILKSNFFIRYGQFLERQNMRRFAIEKYASAYELASKTSYFRYMLQASERLHNLHNELGQYKKAYEYSMVNKTLGDSLDAIAQKDKLIMMEFSNEMKKDSMMRDEERRATAARHKEEVDEKRRQTRTAAGVGLGILVLAGGLYNRLRFVRRSRAELQYEKDRSEGLLLNILPKDIAEELKQNGSAKAQKFENVSILFTDFKDFTQAAEQLGAIDLVSEINEYFQLFDQITSRYGVEKIKTIGDAYMAAGGIPRFTADSPRNTVLAALEMQEAVNQLNKTRNEQGLHNFEMRVGIHTGAVVAGIVGSKKFQYDIYGDSVNTAARMEQSGEIGRVNVSESTYNLLKNEKDLKFEARGKIEAKNKGEIEMYFVNRGIE